MRPLLSIVVPARNEAGNIPHVIPRLRGLEGVPTEILFVEGHSTDDTWERIREVCTAGAPGLTLRCFRQRGAGKADAVRLGFEKASGEILAILDADLSTPPELMGHFLRAYRELGRGLLIGDRFRVPMEDGAMPLLNRWGNRFFAWLLSRVTGLAVGDALCGTKLIGAADYRELRRRTPALEAMDPFGDFHLILGAATLGLPLRSLPVPYRARTYGTTNIRRFRDGWRLLRLALTAAS